MYTISFLIFEILETNKEIIIRINNKEKKVNKDKFNYSFFSINRYTQVSINDEIIDLDSKFLIINLNFAKLLVINCKNFPNLFYKDLSTYKIIGHRGFGMNKYSSLPENTLKSFNTALNLVDWVEMDVQLNFNNIPVVYHDFYKGEIEFKDEPTSPCTLDYVLKNIKEGGGINVEIKYPVELDPLYWKLVNPKCVVKDYLECKNEYFFNEKNFTKVTYNIPTLVDAILDVIYNNNYGKIFFSSFLPSVLLYLKMRVPDAKLFLITDLISDEPVDFSIKTRLSGMVFNCNVLTKQTSSRINKIMDVYVYNVNNEEELLKCREMKVTGIITDKLEDLLNNFKYTQ